MKKIIGAAFMTLLFAVGGARQCWSQAGARIGTPNGFGVGGPCRADVNGLCPGQRDIGPWAVQKCLASHIKEVTLACRDHLIAEGAVGPEVEGTVHKAILCQPDQQRFCPGISILVHLEDAYNCLFPHMKELSPGCQPEAQAAHDRAVQKALSLVAEECKEAAGRYCKGIPPSGIRFLDCLLQKKIQPVKACSDALAAAEPYRMDLEAKDVEAHPRRSWWRWW